MDTRNPISFGWFLMVLLIFLMKLVTSTPKNDKKCWDEIRNVVRKPVLGKVGAELMKMNENSGEGFAFSELKILQRLLTLYPIVTPLVQNNIKSFFKLDVTKCNQVGTALDELIETRHWAHNVFEFDGALYVQSGREHFDEIESILTQNIDADFNNASGVLSDMNKGFEKNCKPHKECFRRPLNPQTNFLFLSTVNVEPEIFAGKSLLNSDKMEFTNLEGAKQRITWVKITENHWVGTKSIQSAEKNSGCESVTLYKSELGKGELYMLYFHPEFPETANKDTRSKCIQSIFNNIKDYIRAAIDEQGASSTTCHSLAVPLMDILYEFDLKPILQNDIGGLFSEDQITGVYNPAETLHELPSWGFINNRPPGFEHKKPKKNGLAKCFLSSTYVFALVEKNTEIVLKAGAMLRPSPAYV